MRQACRFAAITVALCAGVARTPASGAAAENPPEDAPAHATAATNRPQLPAAASSESRQWITTRVWVAGCSAPDDLWKYRKGSSTVICDPRGRTLASTTGELVWPDYLNASDLDTVILEGEGLESLRFELAWSTDDNFTVANSIEQASDRPDSPEVRFTLRGAPGWQGLVRRFRLTWRGEPSSTSRIVAAWGKKERVADATGSKREEEH